VFTRAIVRPPGASYAAGLTSSTEGVPDLGRAIAQHHEYCNALRECGLSVHALQPDERYPDGTFVEDTAVISGAMAVVTRPGAPSREGEIQGLAALLQGFGLSVEEITAPGSVDGGDICQIEKHFLIGLSHRTNAEGARQLARILERYGYSSSEIDIRNNKALLHLKSGLSYLGENRLLVVPDLIVPEQLSRYQLISVSAEEGYAANCVRINDRVLVAAGYPRLSASLERLGYSALALPMSEFRKMDGGLSCLSLRF